MAARVVNQPKRVERSSRGVAFLPPRDFLEIEIPPALTMGPADMEIKLHANGLKRPHRPLHRPSRPPWNQPRRRRSAAL